MNPDRSVALAQRAPTSSSPASVTLGVLASPPFVVALGLLLLNDWVLKDALGNWLTGKLSDVAGLAAFAMFWAALLPARRRAVFIATAVVFTCWKSPLSEPVLHAWNSLGVLAVARVQDWSDLVALVALAPAWLHVCRIAAQPPSHPFSFLGRIRAVATAVIAIMAFAATSVYRPHPIEVATYGMPGTRDAVIAALDSLRIPVSDRRGKREERAADTLVVNIRHPPERWLYVTIEVRDVGPGASEVRTIALGPVSPLPSTETLQRVFVLQVVEPVRRWLSGRGAAFPAGASP